MLTSSTGVGPARERTCSLQTTDRKEEESATLAKVLEQSGHVPTTHTTQTAEEHAMNRALNRRLDFFLLPFLSLLYLFNGLDRGNVGNAETQGMYVNTLLRAMILNHLQGLRRTSVHSQMTSMTL